MKAGPENRTTWGKAWMQVKLDPVTTRRSERMKCLDETLNHQLVSRSKQPPQHIFWAITLFVLDAASGLKTPTQTTRRAPERYSMWLWRNAKPPAAESWSACLQRRNVFSEPRGYVTASTYMLSVYVTLSAVLTNMTPPTCDGTMQVPITQVLMSWREKEGEEGTSGQIERDAEH